MLIPTDKTQFDSVEERDETVKQLDQSLDLPIEWTNNPTAGTLAFGLAYLKEPLEADQTTGQQKEATHIFGRYFKQMSEVGLPANWNSNHFLDTSYKQVRHLNYNKVYNHKILWVSKKKGTVVLIV